MNSLSDVQKRHMEKIRAGIKYYAFKKEGTNTYSFYHSIDDSSNCLYLTITLRSLIRRGLVVVVKDDTPQVFDYIYGCIGIVKEKYNGQG